MPVAFFKLNEVRFGSLAEMEVIWPDIRFVPKAEVPQATGCNWQLACRLRKYLEILDRNPVKKIVDILLQFSGGRRDRLRRLQHGSRMALSLTYRFDNMIEH